MSKRLFIAYSKEGESYAHKLKELLENRFIARNLDIRCETWQDLGLFQGGGATLEELERIADEIRVGNGYSVAMCTPDDTADIRGIKRSIARDNVIFEFGLFMGKLGRKHSYAVVPQNPIGRNYRKPDFWFLTDLSGINESSYQYIGKRPDSKKLQTTLMKSATEISDWIATQEKNLPPSDQGNAEIYPSIPPTGKNKSITPPRRPFEKE